MYDHYEQRFVEYFKDQDRMLMCVHAYYRDGRPLDHIDLLARGRYLQTGITPRMQTWLDKLDGLEIQARFCGSDVIGLEEFLMFDGWMIRYVDVGKTDDIDYQRYLAKIKRDEDEYAGLGATKLEALTRAFITAYKEIQCVST